MRKHGNITVKILHLVPSVANMQPVTPRENLQPVLSAGKLATIGVKRRKTCNWCQARKNVPTLEKLVSDFLIHPHYNSFPSAPSLSVRFLNAVLMLPLMATFVSNGAEAMLASTMKPNSLKRLSGNRA